MLSGQDLFRKFYYSLNCSDKATDIPSQVEEMSEHEVIPEKPKPLFAKKSGHCSRHVLSG